MNNYIHAHDIKAANVTVSLSKSPYDRASLAVEITDAEGSCLILSIYSDEVLDILSKFAPQAVAVR